MQSTQDGKKTHDDIEGKMQSAQDEKEHDVIDGKMQFTGGEKELLQELFKVYQFYKYLNKLADVLGYDVFLPAIVETQSSFDHLIRALKYKDTDSDPKIEIQNSIQHLQRSTTDLLDFISIQQIDDIKKITNQETMKQAPDQFIEFNKNLNDIYKLRKELVENKNSGDLANTDIIIADHIKTLERAYKSRSDFNKVLYNYQAQNQNKKRYIEIISLLAAMVLGVIVSAIVEYFQFGK